MRSLLRQRRYGWRSSVRLLPTRAAAAARVRVVQVQLSVAEMARCPEGASPKESPQVVLAEPAPPPETSGPVTVPAAGERPRPRERCGTPSPRGARHLLHRYTVKIIGEPPSRDKRPKRANSSARGDPASQARRHSTRLRVRWRPDACPGIRHRLPGGR